MTAVTFYGGVGEIGGNKVLVEDKGTRIFVDFGMSFKHRGLYFGQFLNPRSANGLGDFLEMGLVPNLRGLYREDLLATVGRKPENPEFDAVILSHAHLDHSSYISFLHEEIPVYCGYTCHLILEALQESGSRDIEGELLDFKKRPILKPKNEPVKREYHTFRTGQVQRIGNMEIEPVHVDHSIPGDYAFIIHTSEGAIVYTSDLRMHGTKPDMTMEFVEKAKKSEPVALISEGTRINEDTVGESEEKVRKDCQTVAVDTHKLVVADFNFKDVDRLGTFRAIAKATNRKFAVSLKDAVLLKYLSRDPKLAVPPPEDPEIVIIIPRRGTGTYQKNDYDAAERQFLEYPNAWKAELLRKNQRKLVAQVSFYNISELIDIKPERGSIFIRSLSEPFNEEMEIDYAKLQNWIQHFEMKLVQSHASGHAIGKDLRDMITKIQPRILFPIHTEHPESFGPLTKNAVNVELGRTYDIGELAHT